MVLARAPEPIEDGQVVVRPGKQGKVVIGDRMNKVLPAAAALWANDERVAEIDELWASNERTPELEKLAYKLVRRIPHRSILDLGCGTARYADAIKGWSTYVGVDSSPAMVELAMQRLQAYPKRETAAILNDVLKYRDTELYDLAICVHLGQHYEKPLDFAADVLDAVLAKHILMTFIVHSQPNGTVDFKIGWEGDEDGSNIGSRSIAERDMDVFLANYDVVRTERAKVWWHPDAMYWYTVIRLVR